MRYLRIGEEIIIDNFVNKIRIKCVEDKIGDEAQGCYRCFFYLEGKCKSHLDCLGSIRDDRKDVHFEASWM